MNIQWTFLLERLKERTTWVGLVGLASALGITISPDTVEHIAAAGTAVASLILIITKDKPKAAPASTEMGAGKA